MVKAYLEFANMQKILLFVIFQFLCGPVLITAKESLASDWLFASDFQPSELANLTPQEEHQLLLKSLLKQRSGKVRLIILWEIYAKAAGIEFCRIAKDESSNRENTAIVKAAFECATKLQFQERAVKVFDNAYRNWDDYLKETGDLVKTFVRICSDIDDGLRNETFYTTLRDDYKNQDSWQPKKTYLYGIPKSEDDFRKALTEFANNPQLKKIIAHVIFLFYSEGAEREWPGKLILRRLAQVHDKLEAVQKIYDESILELVPEIGDVSQDEISVHKQLKRDLSNLAPVLYKKLKEKINAHADLKRLITDWQSPDHTKVVRKRMSLFLRRNGNTAYKIPNKSVVFTFV